MPRNVQEAPYPVALAEMVAQLDYRPGWTFELEEMDRDDGSDKPQEEHSVGLTFRVTTLGYNTYYPERGEYYGVRHEFPVPPATYNRESWKRWLLDRLIEIETHECCEFFQIDGKRPFVPNHGPGWDPYGVRELNTAEAAETTFRGKRREGTQG